LGLTACCCDEAAAGDVEAKKKQEKIEERERDERGCMSTSQITHKINASEEGR
jgi:hypothetical protein